MCWHLRRSQEDTFFHCVVVCSELRGRDSRRRPPPAVQQTSVDNITQGVSNMRVVSNGTDDIDDAKPEDCSIQDIDNDGDSGDDLDIRPLGKKTSRVEGLRKGWQSRSWGGEGKQRSYCFRDTSKIPWMNEEQLHPASVKREQDLYYAGLDHNYKRMKTKMQ
ncbi:hypothetical protein CBR_g278 [Chara braunii]|uniref:Uncharacterized protein n=1 Tax=Chara braunii TaxID=69332 RepID=A0A388JM31_CHABU|nr:hypothetical protein CBR_g278 [Chara braunii]|eukprot:GBG58879.1 hypothetical protein CBR_g278 [Chara braunii]